MHSSLFDLKTWKRKGKLKYFLIFFPFFSIFISIWLSIFSFITSGFSIKVIIEIYPLYFSLSLLIGFAVTIFFWVKIINSK